MIRAIGFATELLASLQTLLHKRIRTGETGLPLLLSGEQLIRGSTEIRLSCLRILLGLLNTLLLRLCEGSDESFSCRAVLLEGAGGYIFSTSIDRIVPSYNLGRNRYLLGACL